MTTEAPAVRVLGIDPGSRVTGYGVVDLRGAELSFVAAGTIKSLKGAEASDMSQRLKRIYDGVTEVLDTYAPHILAVEEVFVANNARSALILGQARGAILCAGANRRLPVAEYAARQIKQSVVGKGSADKSQVNHMVRVLLGLTAVPAADAADALACAICHCHTSRFDSRVDVALKAGGA